MGLISSLVLKFLGFPDFPQKGEKTFNANETTFGSNLIVTGETVQQSNSVTLREKLLCGNLWMLKNPFDLKPIIPNIFGSFGIITGWSQIFVGGGPFTGILQTLGTVIEIGTSIKTGDLNVDYSTTYNTFTQITSDHPKKHYIITPSDNLISPKGNLYGIWKYNGIPISTDPDDTSDIRLKKNIERFDNGLNIILDLKPVRFDWREDKCSSSFLQEFREPDDEYGYPGKVKRQYGLIAQEVEKVSSDLVGEREMFDEKYKLIRYEKIVPILISAVQDQQKQIEELKKEIETLKDQNK
jgi:hypothetical protein